MRFVTTLCVSVALLFMLAPCAPGQTPKMRTALEKVDELSAIVLSHDGKTLVSVSRGEDRKAEKCFGDFRVWDVKTGKVVASFRQDEPDVCSLALSPDGATLACADRDGMTLWSMEDRKAWRSHAVGDKGSRATVAFSADGKQVGAATESIILICETATGAVRTSSNYRGRSDLLPVFSPDLTLLAIPYHQDVDLLIAATGKLHRTLPDHHGTAYPLAFSADGKTLAVKVSRDDEDRGPFMEIVLWDVATGAERACLKDVGYCRLLALSPDGKRVVLLTETKFESEAYELRVIDAATGRSAPPVPFKRKQGPRCLSLSGDGKTVAVGCFDGTVQVYDLP
jgi:WD40 repeat protein